MPTDLASISPALAARIEERQRLAMTPTPLHRLPRLSAHLGREVWIKRDDMTATSMGGNKIRKMETLAADAIAAGADMLITCGGPQSNHARTVAAVASMLGMECHLVLGGNRPEEPTGNLVLDELFGTAISFTGSGDWAAYTAGMERVAEEARARGRHPYVIPVGGSVPAGSVSYAAAFLEFHEQCAAAGFEPAAVVHASGSGGTQAGLELGRQMAHSKTKVIGVDVAKITDSLETVVNDLVRGTAELIGWTEPLERANVLYGYLGTGYGKNTEGSVAALKLLARAEGIVADHVYTAKAIQAVCEESFDGPVVFWHTGGMPALFTEESGFGSWPK